MWQHAPPPNHLINRGSAPRRTSRTSASPRLTTVPGLDFDPMASDQSPTFLFEHDLFRKPVSTFRDHALSAALTGRIQEGGRGARPAVWLAHRYALIVGRGRLLVEQLSELVGHGTAQLLGIHNGHGPAVIPRDVVTDANRNQLYWRASLDLLDHPAQMALQIVAGIDREGRVIDRRAIGNHHQNAALLAASQQTLMRPVKRLAVDVLLEQALAHHQAEILARAPPGRIGRLVDDVAQVIEAARIGRL